MTGTDTVTSMDGAGAGFAVLVMVAVIAVGVGLYWLAVWLGWTEDPEGLPFEDSPGARNDRARLLEDQVR